MSLKVKKKIPVPRSSNSVHTLPQRTFKREQRKKSAHRVTTTVMFLTFLAILGGAAYTWYNGQHVTAAATQAAPVYKPRAVFKAPKIASDAKVGVATQMATTEVKPGENASISVRTNPEADCTITVKYNTTVATDSGLTPKKADEFGIASWAWTVGPGTPKGTWPIEVACKNKKHSAVVKADLIVK